MEAIKCEMCGSYELEETDLGYICKHCHTLYKKDEDEEDNEDLYLKEQMKKGKLHLDLGNFDSAKEIFEDILEEYPQEAGAYIYYACAGSDGFRDYSEDSIKLAKECKRKFDQVKKKGKDYPLSDKFELYQELIAAFLNYERAKLNYYGESMGLDTLKLRKYYEFVSSFLNLSSNWIPLLHSFPSIHLYTLGIPSGKASHLSSS